MSYIKDTFYYPLKSFYSSIRNVIRWLPIIWQDRDWDGWYIYTILETKIKHQAKYIGDRDWHTEAKRDAERMMLCVRLLKKVKDEEYDGEYMDYHMSDIHWDKCEDRLEYVQLRIEQRNEQFDNYFLKYPLEYKRILNNKHLQIFDITGSPHSGEVKQRIAMNMSYNRQKRAHKILFTLLERNIERWWD